MGNSVNNQFNTNEYIDAFVVYFDILGFKNLVEESVEDKLALDTINDLLRPISSLESDDHVTKRNVYYVSDCVFMVFPINPSINDFPSVLWLLSNIQAEFLSRGYLVRGGMALGKVFCNENHCFGPAVNEAVKIESEIKNPIIALSTSLFYEITTCTNLHKFYCETLEKDMEDAKEYLKRKGNIIWIDHLINQDYLINPFDIKEKLYSLIEDGIKNENENIREKYLWLKNVYKFK